MTGQFENGWSGLVTGEPMIRKIRILTGVLLLYCSGSRRVFSAGCGGSFRFVVGFPDEGRYIGKVYRHG